MRVIWGRRVNIAVVDCGRAYIEAASQVEIEDGQDKGGCETKEFLDWVNSGDSFGVKSIFEIFLSSHVTEVTETKEFCREQGK